MSDDLCPHDLLVGTCTHCSAKEVINQRRPPRGGGFQQSLGTPESVEKYRERYTGERQATFGAYVEVFFNFLPARNFPGGWTKFSRCANAEPALVKHEPSLVRRAEELMQLAGYVVDDSGPPSKGRRWVKLV